MPDTRNDFMGCAPPLGHADEPAIQERRLPLAASSSWPEQRGVWQRAARFDHVQARGAHILVRELVAKAGDRYKKQLYINNRFGVLGRVSTTCRG